MARRFGFFSFSVQSFKIVHYQFRNIAFNPFSNKPKNEENKNGMFWNIFFFLMGNIHYRP
jgi:hypothetical protein